MKKILFLLVAILMCSITMAAKPTKALIITGQNNHNWKVSHLILKEILESDNYEVDFAISPEKGGDMSSFNPSFKGYKLVVVDYNGDYWCDDMKESFMKYVDSGKGVILYHAANNAFNQWDEYESVIALGGWGGRGKATKGYYTEWKDNKLVKYEASDKVGSHGQRHNYTLTCRSPKHPATKGLATTMEQSQDELYDHMKGKANIKDVLYTAYSDPAKGGTGKEEVLIFTVDYGKAKIFHTMLGHAGATVDNSPAMRSKTFVDTFLSGAAWASGRK